MEVSDVLLSQVAVEMCSVMIVKNRCQFCYAFFKDPEKIAEHNKRCSFRFSETFEAFDGKVKFACAVCFDVFQTRAEHAKHEQLHMFPGGFSCSICEETFLNGRECAHHMENSHKVFRTSHDSGYSASVCYDCGAFFEQQSFLRMHNETNCGKHRSWRCIQCAPNLLTEDAYKMHMENEHKSVTNEDQIFVAANVRVPLVEMRTNDETRDNCIDIKFEDPLLVLKEEATSDMDIVECNGITFDDAIDGSVECSNSVGKWNNQQAESNDGNDLTSDNIQIIFAQNPAQHMENEKNKQTDGDTDDGSSIEGSNLSSDGASISSEDDYDPFGDDEGDVTNFSKPEINKGAFECKYCHKKYLRPSWLNAHIKEHGPDGSLVHKCECCMSHFKTKLEKETHTMSAHKEKVSCEICVRSFRSIRSMQAHNRAHHKGRERKKNFVCVKCGASYFDKNNLEMHEQSDCGRAPRFKCEECGKFLATKATLKIHQTTHSGVRDFQCNICGKTFITRGVLLIHTRYHTGEKPYKCDYCEKRFANLTGMKLHTAIHTKIKRYVCHGCGERFYTNSALHKHRKTRKDTCALVPIRPPVKIQQL